MPHGIRAEFVAHRLNPEGIRKIERIGELYTELLDEIEAAVGSATREVNVARTKLQEASMWTNKAIASLPAYWESVPV